MAVVTNMFDMKTEAVDKNFLVSAHTTYTSRMRLAITR